MAGRVSLSNAADNDLDSIATFSLEAFGPAQAARHINGLLRALDLLVVFPLMGVEQSEIRPELRRFVHGTHAIYYRVNDRDILVSRILSEGQDPGREAFD